MSSTDSGREEHSDAGWLRAEVVHRTLVLALYPLAFVLAWQVYRFHEASSSVVLILTTGSVLAGLGSAIMTLFSLIEKDTSERARLNLDILQKDILENPEPWRRWPFIPRRSRHALLDGTSVRRNLRNPEIEFDVGTHSIRVTVPSVYEDFFDLPVFANWWPLRLYYRAFYTYQLRKHHEQSEAAGSSKVVNGSSEDEPFQRWQTYDCLYDVWKCILWFRVARYGTHSGAAVIFSGVILTAWKLFMLG